MYGGIQKLIVMGQRNFQNLKGTFNRYVKHIEKLIDDNQLNKNTLEAFFKQIREEDTAEKS